MADIPVNASPAFVIDDVTADGQTVFGYDFRVDFLADIVGVYTSPAGVQTSIVPGVDFTVSGLGSAAGGEITITTVVTEEGGTVLLYRNIIVSRVTDYGRDLFSADINAELDRVFMILQEIVRDAARAVVVPLGHVGSKTISPENDTVLGWNGDDLVNLDPAQFVTAGLAGIIFREAIEAILPDLPTVPPVEPYKLWNNGGLLSISF